MSVPNSETKDSYFINPDGLKLLQQIWFPENGKFRAFVFIIHGLSEHSSFYYFDPIVKPLNDIGCLVAAHDHIGHGKSDGNRNVVSPIDKLTRDVIVHIEEIKKKLEISDEIPIFLYGHSMGGLIACLISLDRPGFIRGMVLEAPALTLNGRKDTGSLFMLMVRMLAYFMPSLVLKKPVFENLTRNNDVIQYALKDEYRNKRGLAIGTAVNLGYAIHNLQFRLKDIKTPFFVAHGKKDVVVSSAGSQTLNDVAETKDKSFIEYEDTFHMVRVDSDEIYKDFRDKFVDWIAHRI